MPAEELAAVEATFQELRKWADLADEKHALLAAKREAVSGRLAMAVKCVPSLGRRVCVRVRV